MMVFRKKIFFLVGIGLSLFFLWAGIFYWWKIIEKPYAVGDFPKKITIQSGQSIKDIAVDLKQKKIVGHDFAFLLYLKIKGKEKDIKAGEYQLDRPLNMPQLIQLLVRGPIPQEREIKIIEGWNLKDIARYLDKEGVVSSQEFLSFAQGGFRKSPLFQRHDFLAEIPEGGSLEGFLFPDTYRIYKKSTAEEIVGKMLDNFSQKFSPEMRAEARRQQKSVYQIVTMASLLEKEVRSLEDKKIVAGIFWKRIENNYPLQSCATLAYILGVNKKQYSYEDTQVKSPYNTYLNKGLPPGPICSPGLDSLRAALYPQFTDYNFFLSAPDGETIFSKTFAEHQRNKVKYLK